MCPPTSPGLLNAGTFCLTNCTEKQGLCSWCGTGMCCRKGWEDKSNGCDGKLGIAGQGHVCVAPGSASTADENACLDQIWGTTFSSSQCTSAEWNKVFTLMDRDKNGLLEGKDTCSSFLQVSFPTHFRLLLFLILTCGPHRYANH